MRAFFKTQSRTFALEEEVNKKYKELHRRELHYNDSCLLTRYFPLTLASDKETPVHQKSLRKISLGAHESFPFTDHPLPLIGTGPSRYDAGTDLTCVKAK